MNSHSMSTKFIMLLKEIFTSHSINDEDRIANLMVVDQHFSLICNYNIVTNGRPLTEEEFMKWRKNFQLQTYTTSYSSPISGVESSRQEWLYSTSIQIDGAIHCYLLCKSGEFNNSLLLSTMDLLAKSMTFRLVSQREVDDIFLETSYYQRQICDTLSHGYAVLDQNRIIRYMNKSGLNMYGFDESIIGKHESEVFDKLRFETLTPLKKGEVWSKRNVFIDTPKGKIHIRFSLIPLINKYDERLGVIITWKEERKASKVIKGLPTAFRTFHFTDILYQSKEMGYFIQQAKKVATNDATVLIEGESGTGKEMIAQAIHNDSHRSEGPLISIDCSSIPRELVESELFGYEDGAFTGAKKGGKMGKFELANGGTLFLDEIGEMPLEMQAKLLRVLQNRSVTRVGGYEQIPLDVRIIAATNRDLEDEVKKNNFRLDLFYRLNVMQLLVPSLRERKNDIPLLVHSFLEKIASREDMIALKITDEAMSALERYTWPGNVRELENVVERAALLSNNSITSEDLPTRLLKSTKILTDNNYLKVTEQAGGYRNLEEIEYELITKTLEECGGNKSLTAKKLGIARSTLYEKLRQYSI